MPTIMYSIYVGNYESPSKAKGDIAKLNKLGLKAFVFSRGNHYALKVYATIDKEKALMTQQALINKDFTTELEEINLNQSLHIPE